MLHDFNPPSHSVITASPRRKSFAVRLACPLAFSMTGLLLNVVSFGVANDPQLALLRFALVASAPAVAALVALALDGDGSLT